MFFNIFFISQLFCKKKLWIKRACNKDFSFNQSFVDSCIDSYLTHQSINLCLTPTCLSVHPSAHPPNFIHPAAWLWIKVLTISTCAKDFPLPTCLRTIKQGSCTSLKTPQICNSFYRALEKPLKKNMLRMVLEYSLLILSFCFRCTFM